MQVRKSFVYWMSILVLAAAIVLLIFHGETTRPIKPGLSMGAASDLVETMVYVKDSHTSLCFGVTTIYTNTGVSVTNVPCDKVQRYLSK